MAKKVSSEIARLLSKYVDEVQQELRKSRETAAKEAVTMLKKTSPKKTGNYRKGWTIKKDRYKLIIHNKTDYQLTHLLEFGHATGYGGRVPAKPHIKKVEQATINKYITSFEEGIKK